MTHVGQKLRFRNARSFSELLGLLKLLLGRIDTADEENAQSHHRENYQQHHARLGYVQIALLFVHSFLQLEQVVVTLKKEAIGVFVQTEEKRRNSFVMRFDGLGGPLDAA